MKKGGAAPLFLHGSLNSPINVHLCGAGFFLVFHARPDMAACHLKYPSLIFNGEIDPTTNAPSGGTSNLSRNFQYEVF